MTAKWKPEQYKDTYQDQLLKYIKQKIKKGETETTESIGLEKPTDTNIVDLMPLLKKRLATKGKAKPHARSQHA